MNVLLTLQDNFKTMLPDTERLEFVAFMGDASGLVKADKFNNVYVIRHDASVMKVRNTRVPNVARLPVLVGYAKDNPTLLQVLRMVDSYLDPPYPAVPEHAETMHSRWGYDPVFITADQILDGLAFPAADTGLVIQLRGLKYYMNGARLLDNMLIDFTAYVPVTGACWVLAEVDENKVITLRSGASVAMREMLTPADIPLVVAGQKPLFALKMYKGQTHITQSRLVEDIFDMRWLGISSGGGADSVLWEDIIGTPLIFPPDLALTDAVYPRKWLKSAAPTVDDDSTQCYEKSDIWIDQSNGDAYICIDNADGVADWLRVGSGSGDYTFVVDGRLAVATNVPNAFVVTKDVEITACYIYCKTPGTADSTVVDVNKNGVTIYTTQANRPTLAFDDADGWASSVPDILTFAAGDVITLDIDAIATGAEDLVVALSVKGAGSGGGSGLGLTVTDGTTTVSNVGQITIEGGTVIDAGGGEITIKNMRDYILVRDEKANNAYGGGITVGSWVTRDLTVVASDDGGHCSLASNQITLAAGTYECLISAPAMHVEQHKAKLYNITDGANEVIGTTEMSRDYDISRSIIVGKFTIATSKVFEIQHIVNSTDTNIYALGHAGNFGVVEIYTVAEFWKVG
jgi:hypothetical protein